MLRVVLQSAFARYVLNKQLGAVALLNPTNSGRTDADLVFNDGKHMHSVERKLFNFPSQCGQTMVIPLAEHSKQPISIEFKTLNN